MARRLRRRRLRKPRFLAIVVGGSILNNTLTRLSVIGHVERARPLALVFLGAGAVLGVCSLAHRSLGYRERRQDGLVAHATRDASRLARAVGYEAWLAAYFFVAWTIEHRWPNETLEFVLAALGYSAFLVICGRVHRLAASLGLPSISSALLHSPAADDVKDDILPWLRGGAPGTIPPGVKLVSKALSLVPRIGEASTAMTLVATLIAGVACANVGSTVKSAGSGVSAVYGFLAPGSAAQASDPPTKPPASTARGTSRASTEIPAAPQAAVTYEALCGPGRPPGRGAPEQAGHSIYDLWLGPQGVGGLIAGCAEPAQRVNDSGTWYVAGRNGSGVVSLGVAAPDGSVALLLGKGARFALTQAAAGNLISASARVRVGSGDLQIIDTQTGTYVVVDGAHRSASLIVPPGLVGAWLAAVEAGHWTWPVLNRNRDGIRSYAFETAWGEPAGRAQCTSDVSCTSEIFGVESSTSGHRYVTLEQILAARP